MILWLNIEANLCVSSVKFIRFTSELFHFSKFIFISDWSGRFGTSFWWASLIGNEFFFLLYFESERKEAFWNHRLIRIKPEWYGHNEKNGNDQSIDWKCFVWYFLVLVEGVDGTNGSVSKASGKQKDKKSMDGRVRREFLTFEWIQFKLSFSCKFLRGMSRCSVSENRSEDIETEQELLQEGEVIGHYGVLDIIRR